MLMWRSKSGLSIRSLGIRNREGMKRKGVYGGSVNCIMGIWESQALMYYKIALELRIFHKQSAKVFQYPCFC